MRQAAVLPSVAAAFVVLVTGTAAAGPFAGIVKTTEGSPVIVHGGASRPATLGAFVEKGDTVRTDAKSAIGLVFSDDTIISMGPNSEVAIDDYLFEPAGRQLSFVARVLRGTVGYLSGQIAKLSPKSVRLVMPTATIGVRGTHVLISVK